MWKVRKVKLRLILDLDHTLVHSKSRKSCKVSCSDMKEEKSWPQMKINEFIHPKDNLKIWIHKREGVEKFLFDLSFFYELCIYTQGDDDYARHVASLLDPDGLFFAKRIFSSCGAKKDLTRTGFSLDQVVVFDDYPEAWEESSRPHIIQSPRYVFFQERVTTLQEYRDIQVAKEQDEVLGCIKEVLIHLHTLYFSWIHIAPFPIPPLLQTLRQQVLDNVWLVIGHINWDSKTQQWILQPDGDDSNLKKMAQQFGANCRDTIEDSVTHIIITDSGPLFSNHCPLFRKNLYIVSPNWLNYCFFHWKKPSEEKFQISFFKPKKRKQQHVEKITQQV